MGSNHFGCYCGNQNIILKFVNQNGRQFRLHYVRGAIDEVGLRVHMVQDYGARHECGDSCAGNTRTRVFTPTRTPWSCTGRVDISRVRVGLDKNITGTRILPVIKSKLCFSKLVWHL